MIEHLPLIIAICVAVTRVVSALKPLWSLAPEQVRPWIPLVVLMLGHIVAGVAGVTSDTDLAVLSAEAAALLAPGFGLTKPERERTDDAPPES